MERVKLGKTGVDVPELGFGTWAWGDRIYWNYGGPKAGRDFREAFDAAAAAGMDFFDTAEVYGMGKSEKFLGGFISDSGRKITVATKFMPIPPRFGKNCLLGALKKSLGRLGLPKVDLYQLHFPLPPVPIEVWMEGMAEAHDAGLIIAAGVSNCSVEQMRRALSVLQARNMPLASNQVEYSLLERGPEENGVLDECRKEGISLIAYSPVGMGMLTGKYGRKNPPPGMRKFRYGGQRLEKIEKLVDNLRRIGQDCGGKSPGQVAINWTICKGAIPIPGIKSAAQATENLGGAGWRLSGAQVRELDDASAAISTRAKKE